MAFDYSLTSAGSKDNTEFCLFKKLKVKENMMDLNIEVIEEATNSIEVLCNSVGCP